MTSDADAPSATLFICVTCRRADDAAARPGEALFEAVRARIACGAAGGVALRAVECLSVCKRPCTVALAGPGKWTYVIGDLDATANIEDVVEATTRFAATTDGLIPWRQRPASFRKGVVSRTPPLPRAAGGG